MTRGTARGWRQEDRGAGALEYVGILVVLGALVALLVVAFAPGPAAEGTRAAICSFLGGPGCGTGEAGEPVAGGDEPAEQVDAEGESGDESGDGPGDETGDGPGEVSGAGSGEDEGCQGFWGCAGAVAGQVGSGIYNVGKGAVDEVVGIGELIMDPGSIVDGIGAIVDDPGGAVQQIVWDDESSGMWDDGDYGGAIGRTVWNVGSFFIPGAGAAKAGGRAGDLARVGGLADEVVAIGSRVDDAIARGDLGEAGDLAADARRRADDLDAEARRQGCLSAGHVRVGAVLASGGPGSVGVVVLASGSCDSAADAAREADEAADAAEEAVEGALQDATTPPAGAIPPGLERGELGYDPAVGRFRMNEYETALRIEADAGVTLQRAQSGSADWVDTNGVTYDAVGPFDSRFFDQQWPSFQGRIVDHLDKADVVPVDVSLFTPAQRAQVGDYVDSLPQAQRDRIRIVGGG